MHAGKIFGVSLAVGSNMLASGLMRAVGNITEAPRVQRTRSTITANEAGIAARCPATCSPRQLLPSSPAPKPLPLHGISIAQVPDR
jgi:hypothetical protein